MPAHAIAGGQFPGWANAAGEPGRVSIRARHCWRRCGAMGASGQQWREEFSLSIRAALTGGRIFWIGGGDGSRSTSLHRTGRDCWRAVSSSRPSLLALQRARSARAAMAGGRCRTVRGDGDRCRGFNLAPAIAGGRCRPERIVEAYTRRVSIRARHCWRAMRYGFRGVPASFLFQSAPAIAGGRAMPVASSVPRMPPRLAIRARHCWRAMHLGEIHGRVLGAPGFNPRPPLLAGDAAGIAMPGASRGFNPRPPLLAGDAKLP